MLATLDAETDVPQSNRDWPAWSVPAGAVGLWVELQVAIRDLGRRRVSCEEDPGAWSATRKTPTEAARQDEAREACGWCPVVDLCRSYAVAAGEPVGVWGGLNEKERRELGRAGS